MPQLCEQPWVSRQREGRWELGALNTEIFHLNTELRSLRSHLLTERGLGGSEPQQSLVRTYLQAPSLLAAGADRTGWVLAKTSFFFFFW